ncbi:MAG: DEAD/DEAH box helicase, partial [Candidatus Acidiferrales bacterium]
MKQYNLANLVAETQSSLISYLASSLPVGNHANQERLGERLFRLWQESTFKGPYIETLPAYQTTLSLSELMSAESQQSTAALFADRIAPNYTWADIDGRFSTFARARRQLWPLGSDDVNALKQLWTRPLYTHQADAIEAVVTKAQHVVVATGTGSGKTESFLVPILYGLLTEPPDTRTTPGVRALLLYPMNALVEDQMTRLRRLLFWINLKAHDATLRERKLARPITFGRYTGETKVSDSDRSPERSVSPEEIHELGELRYRQEMQNTPPDILVTNFTMLEYMLLRNDDRNLFKSPALFKFLVLDEIHTYHGTRGMEVSTLLCRLRDFLSRGLAGRDPGYRCIGTSATLGTEEHAQEKMAKFATELFGTPFDKQYVQT